MPDPYRQSLSSQYAAVRAHSRALVQPLSAEDQCVQAMPDASPTKWHLAHTTWFFETLVLQPYMPGYCSVDPRYAYLFNSYYESLGPRHARPERGLLTRPSLDAVLAYRDAVDSALQAFLHSADAATLALAEPAIVLGLHHEQQHQELMLTDILALFSRNPMLPVYQVLSSALALAQPSNLQWHFAAGGRVAVGHAGEGFAFDNETPRHDVLLRPYRLAKRPVSCGEYLQFIQDGGYRAPRWWLSEGWAQVQREGWCAPLYWRDVSAKPAQHFTLFGLQPLDWHAPVCHLSFFEAQAYSAWAGARLPTEFEWEAASGGLEQLGQVWEWTRSSYDPYPGFRPLSGIASEYNGKFMVGQMVLRGGSRATPQGHCRNTYRNFFPPATRWQFAGLRLAQDV
jgi:ergothioneine biosynthesis protein EgtB